MITEMLMITLMTINKGVEKEEENAKKGEV